MLHVDIPEGDDLEEVLLESRSGRAMNGAVVDSEAAEDCAESAWQVW